MEKLEKLQARITMVKKLFRDKEVCDLMRAAECAMGWGARGRSGLDLEATGGPCPRTRRAQMTEFIIATIPTFLGVNESGRLIRALRKEGVPCKRIIVNQVGGRLGMAA